MKRTMLLKKLMLKAFLILFSINVSFCILPCVIIPSYGLFGEVTSFFAVEYQGSGIQSNPIRSNSNKRYKVWKAENQLLDELNPEDIQNYQMALMFYSYLNEKGIEFLEEHNYSKSEIIDGLKYVSKIYGYESIVNALLSSFLD